jgi:hypothetical protein
MNTREKNKFAMFNAVNAVIGWNQETVNAMPVLAETATKFRHSMADILRRNHEYLFAAEGAVADKNNALNDLIDQVFRIGTAIYALGRKTGNERYKSAGNKSLAELKHMRQTNVELHSSKIAGIVRECAPGLAAYGFTVEGTDAFTKALVNYRERVKSKEIKIATAKAARKTLFESFRKATEILTEDLDTLIELIKPGNPDFYNQYRAARSIRNLGGRAHRNKQPGALETSAAITAETPAGRQNAPAAFTQAKQEEMNMSPIRNDITFLDIFNLKAKDLSVIPCKTPEPGPRRMPLKLYVPSFETINHKKGLNN